MEVILASDLGTLADQLFEQGSTSSSRDPLCPRYLVVPHRLLAAWLRHRFVLDTRKGSKPPVRANWRILYLHAFIHDVLHGMCHGEEIEREPAVHPFSPAALTWRIDRHLQEILRQRAEDAIFEPLRRYLGASSTCEHRFRLATVLAQTFDRYQVYRPTMLKDWEGGKGGGEVAAKGGEEAWQEALWRRLAAEGCESYLELFEKIPTHLSTSGIETKIPEVDVFGLATMPPLYLSFLSHLPCETRLYLLYPVGEERRSFRWKTASGFPSLQGYPSSPPSYKNPLLCSWGECHAQLFSELRQRGILPSSFAIPATPSPAKTLLGQLQADLRYDVDPSRESCLPYPEGDESFQIHLCHSPLRELEVLRDHMLRWFSEDPSLEPRHIQVLVTDLPTYLPFMEAVFGTLPSDAPHAIPFRMVERSAAATSSVCQAFLRLLESPRRRLTTSEIFDLLHCEAIRLRFDLDRGDLEPLSQFVRRAGIRWGLDAEHRQKISGARFSPATSWRQGLDRLLLGMVMEAPFSGDLPETLEGGDLGCLAPEPIVSREDGVRIGKLWNVIASVEELQQRLDQPAGLPLPLWAESLNEMVDTFFYETQETFADLALLRKEIQRLADLSHHAGLDEVAFELGVVVEFIRSQLGSSEGGDDLTANAVVFSSLRLGGVTPRPILAILGLGDGVFPRSDAYPSFDLLSQQGTRRNGDPSLRLADRGAFLEAILAAERRLHLSYVARGMKENEVIPPSSLLAECKEYLRRRFSLPPRYKAWDGTTELEIFETLHPLRSFDPRYFQGADPRLFSCSEENLHCAQALLREKKSPPRRGIPSPPEGSSTLSLEEFRRFFENPAKFYFTQTLHVDFSLEKAPMLEEEEPFSLEGLDRHSVTQAILEALLRGSPSRSTLYQTLLQQGKIPLDPSGEMAFFEIWEELATFLMIFPLESVKQPLGELLKHSQPVDLRISLPLVRESVDLCGRLKGVKVGETFYHLQVRYTSLKAKDRLRAWIYHLALSAYGIQAETLVIPKDPSKTIVYLPLDAAIAQSRLAELYLLWNRGRREPLPFSPETSFAFAEEFVTEKSPAAMIQRVKEGDRQRHENGMWKADRAWGGEEESDDVPPKEAEDPYLFRAFGSDGPQAHPDFADCALTVFDLMPTK